MAGRPALGPVAASESFAVRVMPETAERWRAHAARKGVPVGDLIREGVELVIARDAAKAKRAKGRR